MDIQINYEYRQDDVEALLDIEGLIMLVLGEEGVPADTEVAVTFVDEETIHHMNALYRDIDQPTDVLSFECDGYDDDFDWSANSLQSESNDDMGKIAPFELGDVIVSVDRAESQAPEYGLSFAEEMSLLITHGLLHLCGYDHVHDDEAATMESREIELLSSFWKKAFKRTIVE